MIYTIILLHGATASNVTLVRFLVLSMLPTTWLIFSKIAFSCGFLIVVRVGLTENYLSNGMKFLLNSDSLSNITLRSLGYIESHTLSNIRDILAKDLSMIGTSAISNHPVAGSIKVMHNS